MLWIIVSERGLHVVHALYRILGFAHETGTTFNRITHPLKGGCAAHKNLALVDSLVAMHSNGRRDIR